MNSLDQKIQAALRNEAGGAELTGEPTIAKEVLTAFRGRNRFLNILTAVYSLLFLAGALWAGARFYQATTVMAQVQWGAVTLLCFLAMGFIKVWFWMEMHTNRVLRELKRVELLILTRGDK